MRKVINKKLLYFIIILVFIICATVFIRVIIKNRHGNNSSKFMQVSINPQEFIKMRAFKINDKNLYIGRNEKELENNFYDIEIKHSESEIIIGFNKIYKEEYSNRVYVDENYLFEVINFVNKKYDLNLENVNMQELVVLIKDRYMEFRNNEESKISNCGKINNKLNYEFIIDLDKNILLFKIKHI